MIITLPWPHADLSPNSRKHWGAKATRVKQARRYAYLTMLAQTAFSARDAVTKSAGKIGISMQFYPPSNRKRDLDNLVAMQKGALDGIADALQVNDSRFVFNRIEIGEVSKPGHVTVTIEVMQ